MRPRLEMLQTSQAPRHYMISAWVTTMTRSTQAQLFIEEGDMIEHTLDSANQNRQSVGQLTLYGSDEFNEKLVEEMQKFGARIRYLKGNTWCDLVNVSILEQEDPTRFKLQFSFDGAKETRYLLNDGDFEFIKRLQVKEWDKTYQHTVVIFGAGASAAYLPGGNELLVNMLAKRADPLITDFLADFFQTDLKDPKSFPSFNQVLNIIEISLDRDESLNYKYNVSKLRDIKSKLIDQMRQYMIRLISEPGVNDPYVTFLQHLRSIIDVGHKVSLITLNYDLFLDHALRSVFTNEEVNYVLDFQGEKGIDSSLIDVIKLHGSLDWMICPTCFSPKRFDDSQWTLFDEVCEKDQTPMQEFLFPPMLEKTQVHRHWFKLLDHSEELVGSCDRIVFIGYSLSDDDAIFRFKLKKRMYRTENPITIQVVGQKGNNIGVTTNWLAKHYGQYFGPVDYRPIGFEEFANVPY